MRQKPALRVRKTGALLVAAVIAFVGTVPLAGASRALAWVLLIPAGVFVWAWRAGTDVYPDELRVQALFGRTRVPWSSIREMAPDQRGQVSALLDSGNAIRLTGVTRDNLPRVLAAAGRPVSSAGGSASSASESASATGGSASPADGSASPADGSANPADGSASPADGSASPADRSANAAGGPDGDQGESADRR